MIRIHEIKIKALENKDTLPAKIEKRLHLSKGEMKSFSIFRESIDARNKDNISKVYSVDVSFKKSDEEMLIVCKRSNIKAEIISSDSDCFEPLKASFTSRPVVVGFGPCGIFAALTLAKAGAKPIVLERGPSMEERVRLVENFWKTGELDLNGNCQFGEGGAGTFSDGKLTTGTKSVYQRFVLNEFIKAGASPEIGYKQKPHIGTDVLREVVVNLRKEIEELGGEVRFNTKFCKAKIENGKVAGAVLENGECIDTDNIILSIGHSARDTVRHLYDEGFSMQQKPFSMGLRIEHSQDMIDKAQYGRLSKELGLGPADYKLNVKTKEGRGVYTFCMCPGGVVVNASSHEGCITCNGMSYFKRDSGKANSALLADVKPDDFPTDNPLYGIEFQEKYEHLAYLLSNSSYELPKEKLKDFVSDSRLKGCLPDFVYSSLKEALPMLGRKLKGFDNPEALMYAIESRSSSPVRINRDENGLASLKGELVTGFYPAGEGAGYAGGIMSAACDGVKTAVKLIESTK